MSITENMRVDKDGNVLITRTQDVTAMLDAIHERPDTHGMRGPGEGRWLGTVPLIVAEQWAKDCGAGVGSHEWARYAREKLKSGEWRKLRAG